MFAAQLGCRIGHELSPRRKVVGRLRLLAIGLGLLGIELRGGGLFGQPSEDLCVDLWLGFSRSPDAQRTHHRPDLDAIAVAEVRLLATQHSTIDDGAVRTAEISEDDPAVAALDGRVPLAYHGRAQPQVAIPAAADEKARATHRDGAPLSPADLDEQG